MRCKQRRKLAKRGKKKRSGQTGAFAEDPFGGKQNEEDEEEWEFIPHRCGFCKGMAGDALRLSDYFRKIADFIVRNDATACKSCESFKEKIVPQIVCEFYVWLGDFYLNNIGIKLCAVEKCVCFSVIVSRLSRLK